ncbi:hypothetical protein ABIC83_002915 [Roseateles asaccharophilus]|uniref:hypothetical protein n=1 Tax=Roseateles asaccharophilus TaxID=582607 RepID=UPI00383920B2
MTTFNTASNSYEIMPNGKGAFNVSLRGCNPMPGATGGFKSVEEAQLAIRVLEHTDGDTPGNGDRFWDLWHRVSGVTQRERVRQRQTAANLGMKVIRVSRREYRWEQATAAEIAAIKAMDVQDINVFDMLAARVRKGEPIHVLLEGPLDLFKDAHMATISRLRKETGLPVIVSYN